MTFRLLQKPPLLALALALAGGVFIVDLVTPTGIAIGMFYLTVMRVAAFATDERVPLITGLASSALLILGFTLSTPVPAGFPIWIVVTNRLMNLAIIWLAVYLAVRAVRNQRYRAAVSAVAHLVKGNLSRDLCRNLLEAVCKTLRLSWAALWRFDAGSKRLRCGTVWEDPQLDLASFSLASTREAFAPGQAFPGRVWTEGRTIIEWCPRMNPMDPRHPSATQMGLQGAIGFPVRDEVGLIGVVECYSIRKIRGGRRLERACEHLGQEISPALSHRKASRSDPPVLE